MIKVVIRNKEKLYTEEEFFEYVKERINDLLENMESFATSYYGDSPVMNYIDSIERIEDEKSDETTRNK